MKIMTIMKICVPFPTPPTFPTPPILPTIFPNKKEEKRKGQPLKPYNYENK
jgi:hypothetical protein